MFRLQFSLQLRELPLREQDGNSLELNNGKIFPKLYSIQPEKDRTFVTGAFLCAGNREDPARA
jgi:hypothetical protein